MYTLWRRKRSNNKGVSSFFQLSLSHDNLGNHFQTNFAMMQHHKYSLSELNDMIPWERQIYIDMLLNYIKEQNEKARQEG